LPVLLSITKSIMNRFHNENVIVNQWTSYCPVKIYVILHYVVRLQKIFGSTDWDKIHSVDDRYFLRKYFVNFLLKKLENLS